MKYKDMRRIIAMVRDYLNDLDVLNEEEGAILDEINKLYEEGDKDEL